MFPLQVVEPCRGLLGGLAVSAGEKLLRPSLASSLPPAAGRREPSAAAAKPGPRLPRFRDAMARESNLSRMVLLCRA